MNLKSKIIFIILTVIVVGVLISTKAHAGKNKYHESHFCELVAQELNGKSEVRTKFNKRIDILTKKIAWECDWTSKPYEAIGQALAYGRFENRDSGIIFFQDSTKKFHKNNFEMMKDLSKFYDIHLKYYKANKKTGSLELIE